MPRSLPPRSRLPRILLVLAGVALMATGCFARRSAVTPETAPAPPPPVVAPRTAPDPGPDPRIAELEGKVSALELTNLEKESRIQDLDQRLATQKRMLDEAIQEVVRAKAKLRTLESRAEAASQMAETEIAFKALRDQDGPAPSDLLQIEQMMKMSSKEFEKENFGGALYLSSQAKTLIQNAQMKLSAIVGAPVDADEIVFSVPLSLQVTKPSNVRKQPNLNAPVLVTLRQGSPVTGYSHKGDWIRVKLDDGSPGWIHESLLSGRAGS